MISIHDRTVRTVKKIAKIFRDENLSPLTGEQWMEIHKLIEKSLEDVEKEARK